MTNVLLIIEDDPFVRRFYERLFRLNNMNVEFAVDGFEGITKAKSLKPRLIFLDVLMPKMNGLEVLKQLKSDPDTAAIEVIMLTNINQPDIVGEAVKNGASGFLIKADISEAQLVDEVKKRLGE